MCMYLKKKIYKTANQAFNTLKSGEQEVAHKFKTSFAELLN